MLGCPGGAAFLIGFLTLHTLLFLTSQVDAVTCKITHPFNVECINIYTTTEADRAFQELQTLLNGTRSWSFQFVGTNVFSLPNDFFTSLHVQVPDLGFVFSNMQQLPHRLIDSLSDSLEQIRIVVSVIKHKAISSRGFRQNERLNVLSLRRNELTTIQSRAFRGLPNMQELHLNRNDIEWIDIDAFHGLGKLKYLDISNNKLKILDDGILHPVGKTLTSIYLQKNNFHCDCDLQWFKNWILDYKTKIKTGPITCATPMLGNLKTLNFCRATISLPVSSVTSTSLPPSTTPLPAAVSPVHASTKSLIIATTTKPSKPSMSCQCLMQKLAAALNSYQKCSTTTNDQTTNFCTILQDTPQPMRSSSSAASEDKRCDCILGKLLVKSIMKQICSKHQEVQCLNVCITTNPKATLSSSEPCLETHYQCHLEKILAKINLQWNCASASNWASLNYCKFTTTPLPASAKAETSKSNNQSPRDNLLSSPFCAGIARLQTISSNCKT